VSRGATAPAARPEPPGAISGPVRQPHHRGAPRRCRGATSDGGCGGPCRGPVRQEHHRGAPRRCRGATSDGGCGGPCRGPPRG
jgi:hypothetical protein